jgi:hypothetical protein
VVYDNPSSLAALGRYRIFALTNNFAGVCSSDATRTADAPREPPPGFSLEEEIKFLGWEQGVTSPLLRSLFHDFCDSSVLGMRQVLSSFNCNDRVKAFFLSPIRTLLLKALLAVYQELKGGSESYRKPDPEFYLAACKRNGVKPEECAFLDDLGM